MPEGHRFEEKIPLDEKGSAEHGEQFWEKIPNVDAVVVLGQGMKLNERGEPVPSLESKMRAIAALELFGQGKVNKIILSGNARRKGYPANVTIAGLMKQYLIERGIPEEAVVTETGSKNTAENLENSLKIIESEGLKKILFETNEYHIPRARQLLNNILEKHGLHLDEASFVSAEKLLKERSEHYDELVSHYEFPDSLKKAPTETLKKILREFLRKMLIYIDRDDKIATFLAEKLRP